MVCVLKDDGTFVDDVFLYSTTSFTNMETNDMLRRCSSKRDEEQIVAQKGTHGFNINRITSTSTRTSIRSCMEIQVWFMRDVWLPRRAMLVLYAINCLLLLVQGLIHFKV